MTWTHGGDWTAFEREYGRYPLDFSANVSPLGVPKSVCEAISGAAGNSDRYPDPMCRSLCEAIAARENIPAEWVLCGGGASDLIWRTVRAAEPKLALLASPCFGEYEAALDASHCRILRHPLDDGFALDYSFLASIDRQVDMVILCNPNNPTGRTIEWALLEDVIRRCAQCGCLLALDECFIDFLDEPQRYTAKGLLGKMPGLLIWRAFTKLYALAGVRLGYALCADVPFLEAMRRAGPPWAVSGVAQAAGIAALQEESYVNQVRRLVQEQRARLREGLCALGLRVVPGEANFLLFESSTPLDEPLRRRGILLRCCGDFAGLDASWYRVAVRTEEENGRLLAALREVLN